MTLHFFLLLGAVLDPQLPSKPSQAPPSSASALTNSLIEDQYQKLQEEDDAAQADVEKWTRENAAAKATGAGGPDSELERRINDRVTPIRKKYEDFLRSNPSHARAHLSLGCFLNDRQDEAGAQVEWERALELAPGNPDVYNNLAGRYSESGPVKKAFEYYAKAIEINPNEPLYYHNFASSMYVLRKRAMTYYAIDEQQVFAKIIQLYSNCVRLAPTNFTYASDLAQTYYSMRPFPADEAIKAWSNTLHSAQDPLEREEVLIHLSRTKMLAGRLGEARSDLSGVMASEHGVLKSNLLHNIEQRQMEAAGKPAPEGRIEKKP